MCCHRGHRASLFSRVRAETMVVNERSRRVMTACGMREVRRFHLEWVDPIAGSELGEIEYEISRDDNLGR